MSTELMRIRLPVSAKAWLKVQADANKRSMNAEILVLVSDAMKQNPLEVVVHEQSSPTDDWVSVSVGFRDRDFHGDHDREEAIAIATEKARELGLVAKAVRLVKEKSLTNPAIEKGTINA